jgi:hypothetical protein
MGTQEDEHHEEQHEQRRILGMVLSRSEMDERTMKILKQGLIPEEVVYTTTCAHCGTMFEFLQKEGKLTDDQRDGSYVSIECPTCKRTCTANYMTPQEYTRKKQASAAANANYMDR